MSLLGTNEHGSGTSWKLDHMVALDGGSNTYYRVSDGADGTGDIYKWENVEALRSEILSDVYGDGVVATSFGYDSMHSMDGIVDLVVADGGFDAQRDSEFQEDLAHKMVVCEAAAAMTLLKRGGAFVIKMFGFRTPETRRVLKDLVRCFEDVVVVKPVLSRPASAERYLVCFSFKGPPLGWDGSTWRDNMLLGNDGGDSKEASAPFETDIVEKYFDTLERDILVLNAKACFGILSCLELKTRKARGMGSCKIPKKRSVDIHTYKKAWRIVN